MVVGGTAQSLHSFLFRIVAMGGHAYLCKEPPSRLEIGSQRCARGGARGCARRVTGCDATGRVTALRAPAPTRGKEKKTSIPIIHPPDTNMDIEAENAALKQRIQELEAELVCARAAAAPPPPAPGEPGERKWDLELDEYKRYGRQMVMPEVGLEGASILSSPRLSV